MKKHKAIICTFQAILMLNMCCATHVAAIPKEDAFKDCVDVILCEECSAAETKVDEAKDLVAVMNANAFEEKSVYLGGLQAITKIARDIPEFYYWQDSEIVDFQFLHSFQTGYVTHALFEILGANGEYGYLIYDCENDEADSFSAAESPYRMIGNEDNRSLGSISSAMPYYFYAPMSYGYGVIDNDGILNIYNIRDVIAGTNPAVLQKTSFDTEQVAAKVDKVRTVVGDADAIIEYEMRRRASEVDNIAGRSVVYPNYDLIAGVPDYQQGTGYYCIELSMSNVLGYWDENGFPNLVPSAYDSEREEYILENVLAYLEDQPGGSTANASIDPAFDAYIEDNGSYRYTGIGISNPDYDDLKAEIYSFRSPCLIGFPEVYGGGHCTTGVGYSCSSGEQVIVHDNWRSTRKDVYQSWSDVNFMFSCMIRIPW